VYPGEKEWEAIRTYLDRETRKKLTALTGINERTLRSYRQRTRKPKPEKLEAIAAALGRMLDEGEG
jgi:transcriptional regulator with XRE-family HTH domain